MPSFRLFSLFTLIICLSGFTGYTQNKTAANLTEAYYTESDNSQIFSAYATYAQDEGLPQVATFFRAIAKSSSIHAANFQKVLQKMGTTVTPRKPVIIFKTNQLHIEESFRSVRLEAGIKYAEYIEQGKKDGETNAVKALRWAKETEQAGLQLFLNVEQALTNGSTASLPSFYWICPKCGNLYDVPDPEDECSYCYTEKTKFVKVGK